MTLVIACLGVKVGSFLDGLCSYKDPLMLIETKCAVPWYLLVKIKVPLLLTLKRELGNVDGQSGRRDQNVILPRKTGREERKVLGRGASRAIYVCFGVNGETLRT